MIDVPVSKSSLTLFFTGGVSLKTWVDVGNLDREIAIYEKLNQKMNEINFLTYGGKEDNKYSGNIENINLLPTKWYSNPEKTIKKLPYGIRKSLSKSDIFKTNQIVGSQIPIKLKEKYNNKLIVRCGFLHSFFLEKQSDSETEIEKARNLEKKAFQRADIGVVTSEWQRQIVINEHGINPNKMKVVPNYVLTDIFKPLANKKDNDLIFIGRSSDQKNLIDFIEALKLLKDKGKPISIKMVGGCANDQKLIQMAKQHNLNINFHANVKNTILPELINISRAFILPSLYEGHPKVLLEAMSCGIPCIGTNVTGIKEDIKHKETGYICETNPESIADAIETVLSETELQRNMGENARRYILDKYSLDKVFDLEMQVIKEVLEL